LPSNNSQISAFSPRSGINLRSRLNEPVAAGESGPRSSEVVSEAHVGEVDPEEGSGRRILRLGKRLHWLLVLLHVLLRLLVLLLHRVLSKLRGLRGHLLGIHKSPLIDLLRQLLVDQSVLLLLRHLHLWVVLLHHLLLGVGLRHLLWHALLRLLHSVVSFVGLAIRLAHLLWFHVVDELVYTIHICGLLTKTCLKVRQEVAGCLLSLRDLLSGLSSQILASRRSILELRNHLLDLL